MRKNHFRRFGGPTGLWALLILASLMMMATAPAAAAEKKRKAGDEDAQRVVEVGSDKLRLDIGVGRARRGEKDEIVSIGKDVTLKPDQTASQVVVIGGSANILGTVKEDAVVVLGDAVVNGTIGKDFVVIGSAKLGPQAVIKGDAVSVGGSIDADPEARILGEKTSVALGGVMPQLKSHFERLHDWVTHGIFWLRPLPHQHAWAWALALAFLLVYLFVAVLLPKPLERCVEVLEARPAAALFTGLIGASLLGPVFGLLVLSIIGLAAIPLLGCAALAAWLLGKAAVNRYVGAQLGRQARSAALENPLAAVAAGTLVFDFLYAVPVVGLVAFGVSAALGFGAVLLLLAELLGAESAPAVAKAAAAPGLPPGALPRAGFWVRFAATAIDFFLVIVLGSITHLFFFGLGAWALYQIGMWTWKGTTVGGIVLGLKGERVDGRPMDFAVAFVRHLSSYLSLFAGLLGFFWAGWDPEKQTWHDKIAGTIVVRVPKAQALI